MVTQNVAAVDINKCLKPGFLIRFWPKKPDLVPSGFLDQGHQARIKDLTPKVRNKKNSS